MDRPQAIFLKKRLFYEVGRFADVPFLEDLILIRKLKKQGIIKISEKKVTTSGRRWQRLGIFKTTVINQMILVGYLLGIHPQQLQNWYRISKK